MNVINSIRYHRYINNINLLYFIYICIMKFHDKYPQLKNKSFLLKVLKDTVFSTMALEDQTVSKSKVSAIVENLLLEQESKGNQFFIN